MHWTCPSDIDHPNGYGNFLPVLLGWLGLLRCCNVAEIDFNLKFGWTVSTTIVNYL
jgi:hypothetical protein